MKGPILIGPPPDHDAELVAANRDGIGFGFFLGVAAGVLAGWVARMLVVP